MICEHIQLSNAYQWISERTIMILSNAGANDIVFCPVRFVTQALRELSLAQTTL